MNSIPRRPRRSREGLKQVSDFCSQVGNVGIDSGNYVEAADAYVTAFEAQSSPAYEEADPALLYYAGYLLTVDGSNNPKSFAKGGEYLTKAIDLGYADTNPRGRGQYLLLPLPLPLRTEGHRQGKYYESEGRLC